MATATLTRRRFLASSLALAALHKLSLRAAEFTQTKIRAAIIGHTGHGDYGHDHDLIFNGRQNIEVVAVADPDEAGRAKAAVRCRALRGYADYREMLQKEKPQLVSIATRCSDGHHAMAMAALRAGAHVYLEKPITRTLAEADGLLAVAKKTGLKIAVAHQMRLGPNIPLLKQKLEEGFIGELLEIRAHGKQDRRAGGEDMIVLGTHLFDLMRFFAGEALWCSALVLQNGHEISLKDGREASEPIGPVAGDDIVAHFGFAKGVYGTFVSRAKKREPAGPWGLEFVGAKGSVRILTGVMPKIYLSKQSPWTPEGSTSEWKSWGEDPTLRMPESERGLAKANRRVVDDWLDAIARDREPVCSGEAGMKALEMAMAVFAAGLNRGRVELPLTHRLHPLENQQ